MSPLRPRARGAAANLLRHLRRRSPRSDDVLPGVHGASQGGVSSLQLRALAGEAETSHYKMPIVSICLSAERAGAVSVSSPAGQVSRGEGTVRAESVHCCRNLSWQVPRESGRQGAVLEFWMAEADGPRNQEACVRKWSHAGRGESFIPLGGGSQAVRCFISAYAAVGREPLKSKGPASALHQ